MEHPLGIAGLVPGVTLWTKERLGAPADMTTSPSALDPLSLHMSWVQGLGFTRSARPVSLQGRDSLFFFGHLSGFHLFRPACDPGG